MRRGPLSGSLSGCPVDLPCAAAVVARANHCMNSTYENNIPVGKYLVSPMSRLTPDGDYASSVSIRSGRGSGTHDRIYRFIPRFATHEGARSYALEQGVSWLQLHSRA